MYSTPQEDSVLPAAQLTLISVESTWVTTTVGGAQLPVAWHPKVWNWMSVRRVAVLPPETVAMS